MPQTFKLTNKLHSGRERREQIDIEITIEIGLFNSHSEKMWVDSPNTNIFNI